MTTAKRSAGRQGIEQIAVLTVVRKSQLKRKRNWNNTDSSAQKAISTCENENALKNAVQTTNAPFPCEFFLQDMCECIV